MYIKRKGRVLSSLIFSALLSFSYISYASVPAGTIIGNAATATYYDENNNQYTTTSNVVQTVVQAVCGVDITPDSTLEKEGVPGQVVYMPFQIKNTGNATFNYNLSTLNGTYTNEIYLDENQNGIIDPGEQKITSLKLGMDEIASVIVAVQIPDTASEGDIDSFTLKAVNADNTDCNDTADGKVTVINDAAFLFNKSVDKSKASPGEVLTYTISFKNVGTKDAYSKDNFNIDLDNDGSIAVGSEDSVEGILVQDRIPSGSSYVSGSASGTPSSNPEGFVVYSNDGVQWFKDENNVTGEIKFVGFFMPDSNPTDNTSQPVLSPDQQGTLTFKVQVDSPFEENDGSVDNISVISFATSTKVEKSVNSNETHTVIPVSSQADISVGGDTPEEDSENNWQDDNLIKNVPAGTWVEFRHVVENKANVEDIVNLTVDDANTNIPAKTIVEFWNADKSAKLIDTDGDGNVDIGTVSGNSTKEFVVRVYIPADTPAQDEDGNVDYYLTVKALSHNNPSEADLSRDNIDGVIASGVDIGKWNTVGDDANPPSDGNTDGTNDNDDILPSDNDSLLKVIINNQPKCEKTVVNMVDPGETAEYPIEVLNRGGHADSFSLTAEGFVGEGKFYIDDNCDGVLDREVTETPLLAGTVLSQDVAIGEDTVYVYDLAGIKAGDIIYVGNERKEVESIDTETKSVKFTSSMIYAHKAGTLVSEAAFLVFKVNVPEDQEAGEHNIVIKAISENGNVEDSMDAYLRVNVLNKVVITPDGSDQLPPGGTTTYQHLITNNGNTPKNLKVIVPDNLNLTYIILDENKNPQGVEYILPDPLNPGESKTIYVKVIAPSDIQPGTVETAEIKLVDKDNDQIVYDVSKDTTTVIEGFMQLTKSVDKTQAKPGEEVTYTIKYKNIGDKDAFNVIVTDNIPNYTDYVANSMCIDNNCDGVCDKQITDNAEDDEGEYNPQDNLVKFRVGSGADATKGGIVKPGEEGCLIFKVKIKQ